MIRNYAAAAIRNLFRNRAYAAINLLGLAMGLAASLLIALYVRDEYNYNRFIPNADRIYQISEYIQPPGGISFSASVTSSDIAPSMRLDFPEVQLATRMVAEQVQLGRDDKKSLSVFAGWADPNFFEMFPWKSYIGDLRTALSQPDAVVLTRYSAQLLFGRENVVGETLVLNHEHIMHVSAVIEDWPTDNTFALDVLLPGIASYSALSQDDAVASNPDAIKSESVYSYVRLRSAADIGVIRPKMRAFINRHLTLKVNGQRLADAYTFILTPLQDIHFLPSAKGEMKPPGDARLVNTMLGIAFLIILLAVGNFVSMMTARSARRAIEVGVRKAVGATRKQITIQFIGECLFFSMFAMMIAITVITATLPALNNFLQRDIRFDYLSDPVLFTELAAVAIAVGLLAGAYPALVLSRFRPAIVLKGIVMTPSRMNKLRNLLVVFQFGALIALLVATITIHRQAQYAIAERLHLPADQIYLARTNTSCSQAVVDSIKQIHGIYAASCTSGSALTWGHIGAPFTTPTQSSIMVGAAPIGFDFFNVFNIKPLAGRLLSPDYGADHLLVDNYQATDNPAIVINESAVHTLGFDSPASAIGQFRRWSRLEPDGNGLKALAGQNSEIVGVIPDFSFGSVRDVIDPTVYYIDPNWLNVLALKMDGASITQTLQAFGTFWSRYDAANPFQGIFLNQYINNLYSDIIRQSAIFNIFTTIAIVIAGLGLLGLAIYTVERRTKEIGLRKVMGARRKDILKFLAWKFASPVLWANLLAWPCAYILMKHWLEGFAYHVDVSLLSFVLAGLLSMAIAFATVVGHALLVARAKPVEALRYE